MKWKLISDDGKSRIYESDNGTRTETQMIYVDQMGNKWWGFADLFKIPVIRRLSAESVIALFTTGFTLDDLRTWIRKEKEILKSNDTEKYEKLYSMILEKEALMESTIDPLKKHLSLAAIYVLSDTELIDDFDQKEVGRKMGLWSLDYEAMAFFLNWQSNHMLNFLGSLSNISEIVLKASKLTGGLVQQM